MKVLAVGDRVVLLYNEPCDSQRSTFRALLRPGAAYHSARSRSTGWSMAKISEIWEEADLLGLMQQLGATVHP